MYTNMFCIRVAHTKILFNEYKCTENLIYLHFCKHVNKTYKYIAYRLHLLQNRK